MDKKNCFLKNLEKAEKLGIYFLKTFGNSFLDVF